MQVGNQNSLIGYKVLNKQAKTDRQNKPVVSHSLKQNKTDKISFEKLPFRIIAGDELTNRIEGLSKLPAWGERLLYGIAALSTQPFIELADKNVDKDTKKTSIPRIIGKIVAGTTVGVITRFIAGKAGEYLNNNGIIKTKETRNLSYIIAIAATLATTFTIDAPATKLIMNNIIKLFNPAKKQETEVKKS